MVDVMLTEMEALRAFVARAADSSRHIVLASQANIFKDKIKRLTSLCLDDAEKLQAAVLTSSWSDDDKLMLTTELASRLVGGGNKKADLAKTQRCNNFENFLLLEDMLVKNASVTFHHLHICQQTPVDTSITLYQQCIRHKHQRLHTQ